MTNTRSIMNTLNDLLSKNNTVFIAPHIRPDFDAIGAAIGVSLICRHLGINSYIILDKNSAIDCEVKKIIGDTSNDLFYIDDNDISSYMTDKSLLITVDVNKEYLLSNNVRNNLHLFNDIMVIDHHRTDDKTIGTNNIFIDYKLSSTCEEISRLIFEYGVNITPDVANYLLAGIILDTNKFSVNTSSETFRIVTQLTTLGADATVAYSMFLEDYENDRKMLRIVNNVIFPAIVYAVAYDQSSDKIYLVEDIAKASDYLLKYKINAAFALGYINENTISISARSKGIIDVSSIMKLFGGGGNEYSAAARIKDLTVEQVVEKLNNYLMSTNIDCPKLVRLKNK